MPELFHFIEKLKPHIPPGGIAVSEKDEVWLLDNTAFRPQQVPGQKPEPWQAEFVAAFFHHNKESHIAATDAVSVLMHELGLSANDAETKERVRERIAPFMRSIGSNMTVDILFDPNKEGGGQLKLGPSDGNGISSQVFAVPAIDPATGEEVQPKSRALKMNIVSTEAEAAAQKSLTSALETGTTYLAEDGGWAVISDLDDTAKISCVNNHHLLLQNTFVNEPQHSEGMPELYNAIHDALSTEEKPTPFFYISASPYNLYPFLNKFLKDSKYPGGMIILRDMSWMDIHNWYSRKSDSFLHSIPVKNYKDDRFKKVSTWLPNMSWVCFGDSTQSDPEAYAEFYNQLVVLQKSNGYRGRVARIFIRKVVGVNPELEVKLNAPERFETAFAGIPKNIWKVFEKGEEVMDEIEGLRKERLAAAPPAATPILQQIKDKFSQMVS